MESQLKINPGDEFAVIVTVVRPVIDGEMWKGESISNRFGNKWIVRTGGKEELACFDGIDPEPHFRAAQYLRKEFGI